MRKPVELLYDNHQVGSGQLKTGVFGDAGKRFQKLGFQPPVSKLAADVFIQDRSIGFFIF